jgi:hypothetical protein
MFGSEGVIVAKQQRMLHSARLAGAQSLDEAVGDFV